MNKNQIQRREDQGNSGMIRLYHGTSSYWLGHILEHGLGAQNILEKYDILQFGHRVIKIANQHLSGFEVMTYDLPYLKEMLIQKAGTGLGSWSHGSTFLSSCPFTAARYAHNEWGSEILTRCFKFIRAYSEVSDDLSLFFEYFDSLYEVYKSAHSPILLVLEVEKDQLLDEAGKDGKYLEKALNNVRLTKDSSIQGGSAFRLRTPVKICVEQITVPIPLDMDKRRFRFLKVSEMTNNISL
jgi:hypothetical protein